LDVAAPSGDDFIDRAMAELSREYPERVRRRTRREMQAMIERGRERARGYGLEEEGHVMQFLQCVMLLDNELASPSSPEASDVYYTLTVPNKPAAQRIRRALQMAKRIAADRSAGGAGGQAGQSDDHDGGPVSPPVARASAAAPASPPPVYARAEPAAGGAAEDPSDAPMSAMDVGAQTTRGTPPPSVEWTPEEAAVADALPEIEGFQIIDKIASGGMGTVYRAVDMKLDVEVAIKVLRSLHPSAQQQFLLEARAAAKLQHPNIVPVLRYEQYGQGGYFVMQLIKGKDSHKLIRLFGEHMAHDLEADRILELAGIDTSGMIPDLRAASRGAQPYYRFVACWLAGVADGLERAHGQGIIHYDIKPNNIMLAADGRMMLGDFGLATLGGRQSAENLACVGTPAYLAPEMVAAWASRSGTSGTDLRVDVWGVGATLYEFLTYKPAYDGTLAKVLRDITTVDPATPRNIVWHTPPELERICLKAMNRNPDDRYARCGEIADELRNWLMNSVAEGGSRKVAWSWLRRPR
jgi:serine/threonine protein kinase